MSQIINASYVLPPSVGTTFRTTAGDAIPALNILTLSNGSNFTFSGAGSAITGAVSLTPTFTTVYSTTFDTNVAAAGLTLSGTTLSADGTDANININITAKGTGQVIIDDLQLGTPLTVPYGGTGLATHTIHGVLIGNAAGTINAVADVVNAGYVLMANAAADPSFQALPAPVVASFASDAETIAGTVTNKAVAPSNLKAKLGLQTIHALPIGASDSAALGWLSVGGDGTVLVGNAAANPSFSANPTVTTIYATTFDTNVVAAGSTLNGVTWAADGTDANIGMTITPKGTGELALTSGNINLPVSNAGNTSGCIYINGVRYFSANRAGTDVTGLAFGYEAGLGGANNNFAVGYRVLKADVAGGGNTAAGINVLNALNNGNGYLNVAFGNQVMTAATSGAANVMLGNTIFNSLGTGNFNVGIGYNCGSAYSGADSNNICIGSYVSGTTGQSNSIHIGDGTTYPWTTCFIGGIYGITPGGTKNICLIDSNKQLGSVATIAASMGGRNAVVNCTASNAVAMAVNTDYIATSTNGSTLVVFTLPATSVVGDEIKIVGVSTGLWEIDQNAGNTIFYDLAGTTPGVTGKVTVTATHTYSSVTLRCITANANWVITNAAGLIVLA